jgi:hypothetical protein
VALVDQHTVPYEGMENRMPDLLPQDGLPSVRHLEQPKGTHVALLVSSECPPSDASCLFLALEETLDASLLVNPSKRPSVECTCSIEDQKLACPLNFLY